MQDQLQQVKQNLKDNLWRIINKKPIVPFHFKEYLMGLIIESGYDIVAIPLSFLDKYARQLTEQYASVLDYLEQNLLNIDIFELEKYIKHQVNGNFGSIIKNFMWDYAET